MSMAYRSGHCSARGTARAPALVRMFHDRLGRIAAGLVLASGALVALGGALLTAVARPGASSKEKGLAVWVLLLSWPASMLARALVRGVASAMGIAASDDAVRLEARLYALEAPNIAWPLVGIAFAAPLSIHFALFTLFSLPAAVSAIAAGDLSGFTEWMAFSTFWVGLAHVGLALHGVSFATRLHRSSTDSAPAWGTSAGGALVVAVCGGAVPGVILYWVPPIVVFITGALFVPVCYRIVHQRFVHERAMIAHERQAALARSTSSTLTACEA